MTNTREEHCAPLEMTRGQLVETITRRSTVLEDWGEHCARRLEVAKQQRQHCAEMNWGTRRS